MNIYLVIIITILVVDYLADFIVEYLNVAHASPVLPGEFEGYLDAQRYRRSQEYLKTNTRFKLIRDSVFTAVTLVFILAGGFRFVDRIARAPGLDPVTTGLIFAGILTAASQFLGVPFAAYRTFVIEERFGFNRTTVRTFIIDIIKSWLLLAIIGGVVFSLIVWLFEERGPSAWLVCWLTVTAVQIFLMFIAPAVILPLFNKFTPLTEGPLKTAIEDYALRRRFAIQGVFTMDGSRRSTKANAFFTGFGKFRRIALFDTLIAKHTVDELVSVLAHEIGHYQKNHVIKNISFSIASNGVMFFILSGFIKHPGLFAAFGMEQRSVYASIFFFAFLYAPISLALSIASNGISRRYEYEADRYAVATYGRPDDFIEALKKLSVDSLSNLTPHPAKVFWHYTHPPILRRIEAIRAFARSQSSAMTASTS